MKTDNPADRDHRAPLFRRRLLYAAMALTPALAVAGNGEAVITPDNWDFGQIPVNQVSQPVRFELANTGTADLAVSEVSLGSNAFELSDDACTGTVLAAGQTCSFDIRFTPQQPGKYLSGVEVFTDADPQPVVAGLSGEATAPYLDLQPEAIDFGDQAVDSPSSPQTLSLANGGQDPLEVTAVTGPQPPFSIAGGDCPGTPFTLAPDDGCSLELVFTPPDDGSYSGTVTVASNSWGGDMSTSLSGQGQHLPPALTLEPASVDFGATPPGVAATAGLMVRNGGTLPLSGITLSPPSTPFSVAPGNCPGEPFSLEGGGTCSLEIAFEPPGAGHYADEIALDSDNGGNGSVALAGRGEVPQGNLPIPALSRPALWGLALLLLLAALPGLRRRLKRSDR